MAKKLTKAQLHAEHLKQVERQKAEADALLKASKERNAKDDAIGGVRNNEQTHEEYLAQRERMKLRRFHEVMAKHESYTNSLRFNKGQPMVTEFENMLMGYLSRLHGNDLTTMMVGELFDTLQKAQFDLSMQL